MSKPLATVLVLVLLAAGLDARSRRKHSSGSAGQGTPGQFDYYLLSLSWAPDFCDSHPSQGNNRECGRGNHTGFIVHGLWPQFSNGGYPKQCAPARPVATDIVNRMLPLMMDAGLIQHEWADHGTCSGLNTAAYFDTVTRAFQSIHVPGEYTSLNREIQVNPQDVESKFAAANSGLPKEAIRVACGGGELTEVRICFSKDLKVQSCSANDRDCSTGGLRMLPPR